MTLRGWEEEWLQVLRLLARLSLQESHTDGGKGLDLLELVFSSVK